MEYEIRHYRPGDEIRILETFNAVFAEDNPDYIPSCVKTAPEGAFQMLDVEEKPEAHIFFAGDHVAVKSPSWLQKEGKR